MPSLNNVHDEDRAKKAHALAEENIHIVYSIAKSIIKKCPPTVSIEDLIGAGVVGLLECVERFDETLDIHFKTYAEHRIRGAILDELRKMDHVSRDTRKLEKKIQKSIEKLEHALGTFPTDQEIALDVGIEEEQLHKHYRTMFSNPVGHKLFYSVEDIPDDTSRDPYSYVYAKEERDRLRKVLRSFDIKTQTVLKLYYVEKMTLKNIGVILSLTESRVCQILHKSILIVQKKMK